MRNYKMFHFVHMRGRAREIFSGAIVNGHQIYRRRTITPRQRRQLFKLSLFFRCHRETTRFVLPHVLSTPSSSRKCRFCCLNVPVNLAHYHRFSYTYVWYVYATMLSCTLDISTHKILTRCILFYVKGWRLEWELLAYMQNCWVHNGQS